MKNNFIIAVIFSITLMGCSDQLERFPSDQLVIETAFQTVGDLQNGVAGFIGSYNPNSIIAHNSIFTDDCRVGINNGGQELNALQLILNPQTGDRGLWNTRYGVINDINRLIVSAESIVPDAGEQAQFNDILAQCYAFRALSHYDVLLYYGLDIRDSSAPGVPYIDFVSADAFPSRNTVGEVLAGIEADLALSLTFMAGSTDISFATPDFVNFLRARIALETGNNSEAINLTTALIANFPLATPTQYFNMFNEDADVTEVIWRYDNIAGFNRSPTGIWQFGGGNGFVDMSSELLGLLDPDDIRRAVNFTPTSDLANGEILIGKYPQNADTQAINDFKAMRISEAYLIRAEAYARNNQLGLAAADVFSVRDARFLTPVAPISYTSQSLALTDILAERRLELAFEGHRYNDLKRMGLPIQRIDADCVDSLLPAAPCELPASSERFIFPIPQGEINANPNITQAPGY